MNKIRTVVTVTTGSGGHSRGGGHQEFRTMVGRCRRTWASCPPQGFISKLLLVEKEALSLVPLLLYPEHLGHQEQYPVEAPPTKPCALVSV